MKKLCFSTLGCTDWNLDQILSLAEQFEISALEIRGMDGLMDNRQIPALSESESGQTLKKMDSKGVKPWVLGTSCSFHDENKWFSAVEEGKACIDIASRMEIPYIRVFGNKLVGDSSADQEMCYDRVANGIAQLCQYASNTSVTILLEVHGDYNRIETLGRVTAKLAEYQNFGLIWDIAHTALYLDRWCDFYDYFKPLIRHIHIKDRTIATHVLTLPGDGELPILAITEALLRDGYDGYFSLEWEKKWHPELSELPEALSRYVALMNA